MDRKRINFLFLNVGHFYDHFFVLTFATAAALTLINDWNISYGQLITFATPGFIAFGVCALPAGWLADKWSRQGMMVIFFIGIGASSIVASFANSPFQIALGLLAIGVFAAIYHPVGLALVVEGREKTGVPLAINGVFGNLGVAGAALITGFFIDFAGWRSAFWIPGIISIATGVAYAAFIWQGNRTAETHARAKKAAAANSAGHRKPVNVVRLFAIMFYTTAVGGLVFQATTFALPKIFDERLQDLAGTATLIGWYAFLVFSAAAFAQLVVGYLVDRHSLRTVFAAVATLQVLFFALMQNLVGVPALLVSLGFMLVVFGQIPINDVLVGRITRPEWRSRVYAFRYIVSFSVSASTLPLIGWIHLSWGFSMLFIVLAVAAATTLTAVLMLPSESVISGNPETAPAE